MFKSRKEFIQAMLDGRKFTHSNVIYKYDGGDYPFQSLNTFYVYNKVTEILPKPEPFKPKPGDMLLVWDNCISDGLKLEFFSMDDTRYVCRSESNREIFTSWKNAKVIPEETKWFKHDGKSWPKCKPGDEIEGKDNFGSIKKNRADWFIWSWDNDTPEDNEIVAWKLVK